MLDDRKIKVLQAIIHSYITTAEPIGSRTISKQYNLGVSSATIRNEMSDLEDLGYLSQPYTSAGRIPSDKAYRLYVDNLMKDAKVDNEMKTNIKQKLYQEIGEVDQLIQKSAKILSGVTKYTSLAVAPQIKKTVLKHIQLVPIDEYKILLILVSDSGIVKNSILRMDEAISPNQLNKISNFFNVRLTGYTFEEIGDEIEEEIIREMYDLSSIMKKIIPVISQSVFDGLNHINLFSDGVTNIFNFPEYNDISKAKSFISFIEDKNAVIDTLLNTGFNDVEIKIGEENFYDQIKDCSVITATYRINGKIIGKIGVIGPTRMNYSGVISTVKSIAVSLNEVIEQHLK